MRMKTIAVDFDGVLHRYSKGWQDGTIYDPPTDGAKEAMERLKAEGYRILIYSTRCSTKAINGRYQNSQAGDVQAWLEKHGIPFDEIHTGDKPFVFWTLDDRVTRFTGDNWDQLFEDIK